MNQIMPHSPEYYQNARKAMIDSQIHPMGVSSEAILAAFEAVPREVYVPENLRGICYCDEDLHIADNRYLMEPSVLARMIEHAKPKADDVALTIGSGIGYNASILSSLVSTVIALEENPDFVAQAQNVWDDKGYVNIVGVEGPLTQGWDKNAPYDLILINGAVSFVPETIKQQLNINGRIIVPIRKRDSTIAKVTFIERINETVFSDIVLFDSGTPYLKGFEPAQEFIF